ncbi:unnamed protein product [Rhizoctonia solani]|uniref:WIBG Mago-binding domain-containing protein n=1 Tax=Rhizoctonia solani TaxID=456999 RepID=A0A8H3BGX7_9AGAM|nr:unnamed protein product [Rhizoctonia solani]
MSLPPLNPEQTPSGISVDPRTLDRVVASTRRADGSVRKELKIRPGFTPQEDVSRFRGSRQQAADRNALPKGHIMGWVAPSSETKPKPKPGSLAAAAAAAAADTTGMTKAQKKNAKRAEKRAEKRTQPVEVKENWDDDDDETEQGAAADAGANSASGSKAEPTDVDAVTKDIGELKV